MAVQHTSTTSTEHIDGGERHVIHSRVSENGTARIAAMVVNMYADPVSAVTREYIANAVDASIAAGSAAPVEVTVPTRVSPTLTIKDSGTGMDFATVENAFLAFAESTKGDTNDQVGGLGVGAKSAWTLCESFVVDTVKDGKRNVVRAARDLEHEVMVHDAATELPSGTTVIIPVNADDTDWSAEIIKVATFHKSGSVLIDGEPVASVQDGKRIGPVRLGCPVQGTSFAVLSGGTMFGVPHTLHDTIRATLQNVSAVIELPVGSFSHTPNRDFLIADTRTRDALKTALEAYSKAHGTILKRILKRAQVDVSAALVERSTYLNGERSRNILPMPQVITLTGENLYMPKPRSGSRQSVWKSSANVRREIRAFELTAALRGTVVVTDVPKDKVLLGIGRYMDDLPNRPSLVIALGSGDKNMPFKVTGSAEGATLDIGASTEGVTVVSYDELISRAKELAARDKVVRIPAREVRYAVSAYIDGALKTGALTLTEAAALRTDGTPVLIGNTSPRPLVRLAPKTDFILIDPERRSHKPIMAAFPDIMHASVYRDEVTVVAEKSITEDDIMLFVREHNGGYRHMPMVTVAAAVASHGGVPDNIVSGISTLVKVSAATGTCSAEARGVLESIQYTLGSRSSVLERAMNEEWEALTAAYPLLDTVCHTFLAGSRNSHEYDAEKMRHIVEYVVNTAPVDVIPST